MRRRTRQFLVYASIIALAFLESLNTPQSEVRRNPTGELNEASSIAVGPLLFRPRVVQPPATGITVRAVHLPDVVTASHAGQLPLALGERDSLQAEHVRLQI